MNQHSFQHTLFTLSFFLSFCFVQAQDNGAITIKAVKTAYEWNEKVTIAFTGLPQRDEYSNRFDDIIVVPAGTPDDTYSNGQCVYVSKPAGEVAFVLPKPGLYEARVYLYEKPGVISARSSTFKVLSVAEGKLENKTNEELMQIAAQNRGSNPTLMCQAVNEYFRRKPAASHPNYAGMKALQGLCTKTPEKKAAPVTKTAYPIKSRYQCYRLLSTGNEIAEDIFIISANQYKTMGKVGKYAYNAKTRTLTFTSGPLYIPSQKWVGIYTGKGELTEYGGQTETAIIEIRRESDIKAGNKRVLQQCSCVQ